MWSDASVTDASTKATVMCRASGFTVWFGLKNSHFSELVSRVLYSLWSELLYGPAAYVFVFLTTTCDFVYLASKVMPGPPWLHYESTAPGSQSDCLCLCLSVTVGTGVG